VIQEDQTRRLVAMGQMAASLAHEIRNPLGGMELFCSLLLRELKDEPKRREIAEQILKGIRTVDRVIQNCLQFAREIIPQKTPVADLAAYLEEISELVRPRAKDFGVTIRVTTANISSAEFDQFQLQQALINLLSNAVDAVQERARKSQRDGTGEFERLVQVKAAAVNNELTIEIADSGDGIPADILPRIFDPFMTTRTTGTGLGLAITHAIIHAHGGDIDVESTVGQGTKFTVRLPHGRQQSNLQHGAGQSL